VASPVTEPVRAPLGVPWLRLTSRSWIGVLRAVSGHGQKQIPPIAQYLRITATANG
jgi:hypothetical protein